MGIIKTKTLEIAQEIATLENNLRNAINELPDNPKINRLSHNCFIMNFSDLGNNWSVSYHDFKIQYKEIIKLVNRTSFEILNKTLDNVIENEFIQLPQNSYGYRFKLHPKVLYYLWLNI